jgi:hypothetical protein
VFPVKVETNHMSDQAATGKKDGLIEFSPSPQKAEALFIHLQAMLQEQAELLDETKKVMAAWMKRRQGTVEANFRISQEMDDYEDPAALGAAYGDWLTRSMNRILAELETPRAEALNLAEMERSFRQSAGTRWWKKVSHRRLRMLRR